jgi:hypothetical protein
MRVGVGRGLVVGVACCCALYAAPAGARTRVLAHWRVTVSGSVRHTWSLPDSEPCQASGDGSVSARFASTHPQRITIADNGFGPADTTWNGVFNNISGTITAVDGRTRNPPQAGQECDTSAPVPDTRACGTRHFHTGLAVLMPLRTVRQGYVITDSGSFTTPALNAPDGVQDCERDGFNSFAEIGLTATPGAEDLKLPGYPTAARLGSGARHRIVISISQTHRWVRSATTVRHVRLVFTPVR